MSEKIKESEYEIVDQDIFESPQAISWEGFLGLIKDDFLDGYIVRGSDKWKYHVAIKISEGNIVITEDDLPLPAARYLLRKRKLQDRTLDSFMSGDFGNVK